MNNLTSEGSNIICSGEVDLDRVLDITRDVNMRLDNEILQDKLDIAVEALGKVELYPDDDPMVTVRIIAKEALKKIGEAE